MVSLLSHALLAHLVWEMFSNRVRLLIPSRYTWFDRDLTLAGRVLVAANGGFESKLVYIDKPILRVPSLAIHLDRGANDGFAPNKETNLVPVLGSVIKQYVLSA